MKNFEYSKIDKNNATYHLVAKYTNFQCKENSFKLEISMINAIKHLKKMQENEESQKHIEP